MSNPRTPVEELEFFNSPNLKRALNRPPEPELAKREELEQIFAGLKMRLAEALADVKARGMVILEDRFSSRHELYQRRVINPSLKIAQKTESQLAAMAKLLTKTKSEYRGKKSVEDLMTEAQSLLETKN